VTVQLKMKKGYHGWIIARMDNKKIVKGYGPTDGIIDVTTSYRTEVYGTIAVLVVYGMIQSVYNWNAATIEHVWDSESALNRIWNKEKDGIFEQLRPASEAITAARVLLLSMKHTNISPKWFADMHTNEALFITYKKKLICKLTDSQVKRTQISLLNTKRAMTDFTSQGKTSPLYSTARRSHPG
jgi:hypothetical protein